MSDQSAATARRFDLALLAYHNAGDHPTAQHLADRLAQDWFGCDCKHLAQREPPPASIFALVEGLPCTVKVIIPEPEHPLRRLMTDRAAKELASGLQSTLDKLRQMPKVPGRQVKQKSRSLFAGATDRRRKAKD